MIDPLGHCEWELKQAYARIREIETELADWHSGKRYMGGTGMQPGDLYAAHLLELGNVLGKTAGYSVPGTCYPIDDVKELVTTNDWLAQLLGAQTRFSNELVERIGTLENTIQKADALAFQSVAYHNLDKERKEYQEVRRLLGWLPRVGVNAVKS